MHKLIAAILLASVSSGALAQTYPSPTFNNMTVTGSVSLTNPLPIAQGGCGATTAAGCVGNLGLAALGTIGATIPLNNGNNTESGTWTFNGNISGSLNMIHDGSAQGSAPINIQNITGWTGSAGGVNGGLRIINTVDGGLTNNPAAGGAVSMSIFVDNMNGRGGSGEALFSAANFNCDQQPTAAGGSYSVNDCVETDISRSIGGTQTNPFQGPSTYAFYASAASNLTSNPQQPNEGFLALSANQASKADWFGWGFVASRIANSGFYCGDVSGDTLHGFATSCFEDDSQSFSVLRATNTHTVFLDLSGTAADSAWALYEPGTRASVASFGNSGNYGFTLNLAAGNSVSQNVGLRFTDKGTAEWDFQKTAANNLAVIYDPSTLTVVQFSSTGLNVTGNLFAGGSSNFLGGGQALGVASATSSVITFTGNSTTNGGFLSTDGTSYAQLSSEGALPLLLAYNGTEIMRVQSTGPRATVMPTAGGGTGGYVCRDGANGNLYVKATCP